MAACSSGNSSSLVLRITYDELVAYADELDKKKETKHHKKKHHGKSEEKDSKPTKNLDKKDTPDVSKNRKEDFERKESEVNDHKDKDYQGETKQEAKKDEKKLSGSRPSRQSSCLYKEDNVDAKDKGTVTNGDKVNKVAGKRGEKLRKETKIDKDHKECDNYELDLRARTGGVLSFSKGPVHVTAEESPNDARPRGIIKLPQGFDFNSPDKSEENEVFKTDISSQKRTTSTNCSSRLYDPDNTAVPQNKEVHFSRVNEEITSHRSDAALDMEHCTEEEEKTQIYNALTNENCTECVDVWDTSMVNEQGFINQTKVEKKLKTLNHKKAQRLLTAVAQKETMLSNLLSRDMLDKAAFEKICTLSKEIQATYKGIMMLDIAFSIQQEVDQNLWRNGFYKVIETLRKYGKLFLGYTEKKEVLSPEEINICLKEFLKDAETFYKSLLELLQKGHEFSVQDMVNQPRKAENLGKNVSSLDLAYLFLLCVHVGVTGSLALFVFQK